MAIGSGIPKVVKYKNKPLDQTEYIVVDHAETLLGDVTDVCIVQTFSYWPHRSKQLRIWQQLSEFEILDEE
ncbi:MAG: hypothetical protein WC677_07655 [Clostridia bacterium]|jgi:hypothetical protein